MVNLRHVIGTMGIIKSYLTNYKKAPKPVNVIWEVSYRCTCKCGFCDRWKEGPKKMKQELSTEEAKKTVLQLKQVGIKSLHLSGGEPLIRKDIFYLMRYAKKLGISISMSTNGMLIDNKNIKKIKHCFDKVSVSIDSFNQDTHDKIRGVKAFNKAINAVKILKKENIKTNISCVVTGENFKDIIGLNKLAKKHNVSLHMQVIHDSENNFLKVSNKELKNFSKDFNKSWGGIYPKIANQRFLERSINLGYYKEFPNFIFNPEKLVKKMTCFAGSYNFIIGPYGDIYPCEMIRKSQGNVKTEPLVKIWKRMAKLRRAISSKKRKCVCWYRCTALHFLPMSRIARMLKK
jgi:AdoMet-dependent heme synthase